MSALVLGMASCGDGNEPEAALKGVFTVGVGENVCFAPGNLQATFNGTNWTWGFAKQQWEFIGNTGANTAIVEDGKVSQNGTVDLFGWSTAKTTYGINPSKSRFDYTGGFRDWGGTIGSGWFTLDANQWTYLLHGRSNATKLFGLGCIKISDSDIVYGLFILPDDWDDAKRGQYNFHSAAEGNAQWDANESCYTNVLASNIYTMNGEGISWKEMEADGAVFLPGAGYRQGTTLQAQNAGDYWSSTPSSSDEGNACYISFSNMVKQLVGTRYEYYRCDGQSVRLVRYVQ